MPLFSSRHTSTQTRTTSPFHRTPRHASSGRGVFSRKSARRSIFHRKDRDRVAGGYRAALTNPNTTRTGRKHAKHELKLMGRGTHVPILTRIKRTLGIRPTPRRRTTSRRRHALRA